MGKYIFTCLFYIYAIVTAPFYFLVGLIVLGITLPFDRNRVVVHWYSYFWGLHYYWISPFWRLRVFGQKGVPKDKTYIIVSNHQAMLDISLMYKVPKVFKWVSKREVMKIPFIGWALWLHKDVLITRGDPSSAKKMMADCKDWLNRKVSIAIFPEGTRTKDGKVHDFKEGAFLLAKMNKVAILPVVMNGNFQAMSSLGGFLLKPKQTFTIKILPEITAEEVAATSIKEMTAKVNQLILDEHKKMAPELYSQLD